MVVGINTRIHADMFRSNEEERPIIQVPYPQLNFALEAPLAARLVNEIISNAGRVRRSFLGIEIVQEITPRSAGFPVLKSILENTPASSLSSFVGARVQKINGAVIRNVEEALGALEEARPGTDVRFEFERDGSTSQAVVHSTELATADLEKFAHAMFAKASVSVAVENGNVVLKRRSSRPGSAGLDIRIERLSFAEIGKATRKDALPKLPSDLTGQVLVAGTPDAEAIWRIRSIADLGIVVRLAARTGQLFVANAEMEGYVVFLGDGENVLRETLYY